MTPEESHMRILRDLLETQLLGVLGTQHDGEPYTSLVGFTATPDLKQLLFATGRSTRKLADAVVATLLALATAVGVVEEIGETERPELERIFLAKHPQLADFVRSPSCIFLRLRVSVYMVVTRFQRVIELHIDS